MDLGIHSKEVINSFWRNRFDIRHFEKEETIDLRTLILNTLKEIPKHNLRHCIRNVISGTTELFVYQLSLRKLY